MLLRILIFLSLFSASLFANPDSTKKFRINVNAGSILSRNFSNYPLRTEADESGATKYSPVTGAKKYTTGFFVGADFLVFPKEKFKFAFGISFSRTSAEYHSSYTSEGPTSKPGFTKLTRATENDYSLKYTALNFHAGVRNRIFKNIFLTSGFILTNPVKIVRTLNGSTETRYSNSSGGTESDIIFIKNETTNLSQRAANFSLRFKVEYQFRISKSFARVFIFRNIGLLYALPWWGLGISYTVK